MGRDVALVALHGAEAKVHEHVAGPSSFAAALSSASEARRAGCRVVVTSAITRSTCRSLSAMPAFLAQLGASGWLSYVPRVVASNAASFETVQPRLGVALPHALFALSSARARGVPAWIRGAPSCLLGPMARHAFPDPPRAYGEVCHGCRAKDGCPGVDAPYLHRFDGDELAPRAPVKVDTDFAPFVHLLADPLTGDPVPELALPDPPSRARTAVMLSRKVYPAKDEAPSRERRGGTALRGILPELFPDEEP